MSYELHKFFSYYKKKKHVALIVKPMLRKKNEKIVCIPSVILQKHYCRSTPSIISRVQKYIST